MIPVGPGKYRVVKRGGMGADIVKRGGLSRVVTPAVKITELEPNEEDEQVVTIDDDNGDDGSGGQNADSMTQGELF